MAFDPRKAEGNIRVHTNTHIQSANGRLSVDRDTGEIKLVIQSASMASTWMNVLDRQLADHIEIELKRTDV